MVNNIFAIHGAFSSPKIFNFLKTGKLDQYNWDFLNYSTETGGLAQLIQQAKSSNVKSHIIGHSMGGLIAMNIVNEPWVASVTTVSCPLGGIDVNIFQASISRSEFMKEVSSHTEFIRNTLRITTNTPVQHIISCCGFHPWIYEPNDGVVTLKSQQTHTWGNTYMISANHAEVMLDYDTVEILRKFWI